MKPDLCKMFGKEVNEEFILSGIDGRLKINEYNELMFMHDSTPIAKWIPFVEQLNTTAQRDVIDIPWVPKKNEKYFYANTESGVSADTNIYHLGDMMRIKSGNCFRTEKEAAEKGIPFIEQWQKELGW